MGGGRYMGCGGRSGGICLAGMKEENVGFFFDGFYMLIK